MGNWNRSASQLGNKAIEDSIHQELTRRFPSGQFPVNIDVVGAQNTDCPTIQITNFKAGIEIREKVVPEAGSNICDLVIAEVNRLMSELEESGRLSETVKVFSQKTSPP